MPCSSTLLNETAERIAMRRTDSHSCIVIACEAQRAKLARRIKADVKPVPHETAVQLLDPLTRVEDGLVEFLLATAACKQSVEAEVPRREDFNCDPPQYRSFSRAVWRDPRRAQEGQCQHLSTS